MIIRPEHIKGETTHARRGSIKHAFRYGVDFVLIDPENGARGPWLFSRNQFNLASVLDRDHGGPLRAGRGADWAREVFASRGLGRSDVQLLLLTQPRMFGYVFNPVSFWLAMQADDLVAVIAEVSTPFDDRHSYMCHLDGFAPITKTHRITTPKSLHVSPFQEVKGTYEFIFDIQPDRIAIRILHCNADRGVVATLTGKRTPLTSSGILKAAIRRPLGAMRTTILIHWQALRLKLKGAKYRTRPTPPKTEVT
jgi:DUF1365 family protein